MALWTAHRPIDRARHRFIGFSDPDYIDSLFSRRLRVGTAPLEIAAHRNVRYVPPSLAAPDVWASGGLIDRDGDLIPLVRDWTPEGATLLGLREAVAGDGGPVIDGDVLYLGWLFEDFGHLLVETLSRIWAVGAVPASTRVLVHYWPGKEPPASHLAVLAAFGIPRERLLIPDRPVTIASLLMPDATLLLTTMVHDQAGRAFREVASRIAGDAPTSDQPVYFSRSLLPSRTRPVIGEEALEDVLRENGYLIVNPDTLPFTEQVRVAATHRVFVGPEGGARFLTMFSPPGSRCHVLMPPQFRDINVLGSEVGLQDASYHHALQSRDWQWNVVALNVRAAAEVLFEEGLIASRRRIPYLPGDMEETAEFEEAWLFRCLTVPLPGTPALGAEMAAALGRLRSSAWPVLAAIVATAAPEELTAGQADTLMQAFAAALAEERDGRHRFRYSAQVRDLAHRALARCGPDTRETVLAALAAHLPGGA